jgi:membrane-associated phospholipid phosphatase
MKKESQICPRSAQKLAHLISDLLNPIFTAPLLFGALISRTPSPSGSRTAWFLLCLVFSAVLPMAYLLLLRLRGDISGLLIPDRGQRTRPLLVGIGSYLTGVAALAAAGAPEFIVALMGCYAGNTATAALINLRWKISLHTIAAWGTFVALCCGLGYRALYVSPLALAVAWARLHLRAHTPAQVLAGGGLGAFMTFIQLKLWI